MVPSVYRRIRRLAIAGYAIFALAVIGATCVSLHGQRVQVLQEAVRTNDRLARILEEQVGTSFRAAELILLRLSDLVHAAGGVRGQSRAAWGAELGRETARHPDLSTLFLVDSDFVAHASSATAGLQDPPPSVADRDYATYHRDAAEGRIHIGEPVTGVVSGKVVVPITMRLQVGEAFGGIAGASLSVIHFERFFSMLGLPSDVWLIALRLDGKMLFSYPPGAGNLPQLVGKDGAFGAALEGSAGSFRVEGDAPRRAAYRRHADWPVVVVASRAEAALMQPWFEAVVRQGVTVAVLLLSVALLGALALAQLKRLLRAESHADDLRRRGEERLLAFFRANPVASSIIDFEEEKVLEVNAAWERLFEYSRDEVVGRPVLDSKLWISAEDHRALQRAVLERGRAVVPGRRQRKDGEVLDVYVYTELLELRSRRYRLDSVVDVTAERREREVSERMSAMFSSSPLALSLVRKEDGVFLEVNPAWCRLFGFDRESAVGRSTTELGLWRSPASRLRLIDRFAPGEVVTGYEETFLRRLPGPEVRYEPFDALVSGATLTIGGVDYLATAIEDVSEQRRALDAYRRSEERFQRVFRSNPTPMAIGRLADGIVLDINHAFTAAFGYGHADIVGRNTLDAGLWADAASHAKLVERLRSQRNVPALPCAFRRQDGDRRECLIWVESIELDSQPCTLTSVFDVTDLRRAQETIEAMNTSLEERVRLRTAELEASNRELESFSYSVSHDLRAPARAVGGFASLLLEHLGAQADDRSRDLLERIRMAGRRMGELVDGLLALSRYSRKPIEREVLDLSAIAAQLAAQQCDAWGADPQCVEVAPGLEVRADRMLVGVLLENLLSNAFKYSSAAAPRRVRVGREAEAFFIADNGVGFDLAHAERLFRPFERLHTEAEFPGTGIGLATVERIVRRHGGRVWAEASPGAGARFLFTLQPEPGNPDDAGKLPMLLSARG